MTPTTPATTTTYDFGMIGLGTMGRNLVLNIADHGFSVAGLDKDQAKVDTLHHEAAEGVSKVTGKTRIVQGTTSMADFIASLTKPRRVMMLVPAGGAVDAVIADLLPHLDANDLIIDGGNSHYVDTDRRVKALADKGLRFFGMGVSGGELGARFGPAMMPGGDPAAYEILRPILEAVAAKAPDGAPCVAYMGTGSAGHYVKMAHNGIEYGVMQLMAEAYDLMRRGLKMSVAEIAAEFEKWNATPELQSFLVQITAIVLRQADDKNPAQPLIDAIRDRARSKGTGKWTSQSAMDLQVPLLTVDAAVAARDISARDTERQAAAALLTGPTAEYHGDRAALLAALPDALYCAIVTCYAQGLDLIRVAAKEYHYGTDLAAVARIWRAGCIVRAALLEEIMAAFKNNPALPNLLVDPTISGHLVSRQSDFRAVAQIFITTGIPAPALLSSLAYFDSYRTARLPASLTQAQRDYFGAHTYERFDAEGTFHTLWSEVSTAQGSGTGQEKHPGDEQTAPV